MKLKKILSISLFSSLALCFAGCSGNSNNASDALNSNDDNNIVDQSGEGENQGGEGQGDNNQGGEGEGQGQGGNEGNPQHDTTPDANTTIFLAGDSTVKTYKDAQYIAGWGQYLEYFLTDNVTVKNCAQGGRSSRSFINEGRLYDIENSTYTFSENGGNSIGDEIKVGDYLFIQFGHNDDDTKAANSLAERMVPLGEPVNGIYPTTPGEKTQIVRDSNGIATMESVSQEVQTKMASYSSNLNTYLSNSINKYGDSYYEYSSGGTYKWFLKQYIDFARSKDAIPVLVTPVARVAFNSDGTLKSGPGLHGDNFAYVEAVRQLASEENCLLIDLFADTKTMLETTGSLTEAYKIMALKDASGSNSNEGLWPQGFDTEFENSSKEATHYNKFGSFLTAGKIAERLKFMISNNVKGKDSEEIGFKKSVLNNPEKYIAPSNLLHKEMINKLYNLFSTVNVKDPDFTYPDPSIVSNLITNMVSTYSSVTQDNYLDVKSVCEDIRSKFVLINIDDISQVSNINKLEEYEAAVAELVKSNRPVATETIIFNPTNLTEAQDAEITSTVTLNGFKIVGTSGKKITVKTGTSFAYNDVSYTTTKSLSMGGAAAFGTSRYIEFTTTKKATITVVARSSGSDDRIVKMVDSSNKDVTTFAANGTQSITSRDNIEAGTYRLGSAGSGMYIFAIIIEYFD